MSKWQKLSSENAHSNPWYKIRKDRVIRPDGVEGDYFVVELPPGAFIVPFTEDNKIIMVKQFRHTTQRTGWEIPAGGVEEGEDPLTAAKRELQEETSLVSDDWLELPYTFDQANGISDSRGHMFTASGLTETDDDKKEEEGITETTAFTVAEILAMIKGGEVFDAQTVTTLMVVFTALDLIHA